MATMRLHQNPFVQTKHFTCFRRADVDSARTRARTHTHTNVFLRYVLWAKVKDPHVIIRTMLAAATPLAIF